MTAGGCADARISLGAYVLGALEPGERGRVDAHLAECDACRDELASFAALPGLLGRVSLDEVEAEIAPQPHPQMLERILDATVRERRHERRVRQLVAVAAAVIVLVAASVTAVALSTSSHHASTSVASVTVANTDPATGISASVVEWRKAWGSALEVTVTGAASINAYAATCRLIAVSKNGTEDVAASWAATASNKIVAQGSTSLAPSDIAAFKVVGSDGTTLVQIPVTAANT